MPDKGGECVYMCVSVCVGGGGGGGGCLRRETLGILYVFYCSQDNITNTNTNTNTDSSDLLRELSSL